MKTKSRLKSIKLNFASAEDLAATIPGVVRKRANAIVVVRHSSGNIPEVLTTISRRQFSDAELELVDFTPNAQLGNPQDSDSDEDEFEDTVDHVQGVCQILQAPPGRGILGICCRRQRNYCPLHPRLRPNLV